MIVQSRTSAEKKGSKMIRGSLAVAMLASLSQSAGALDTVEVPCLSASNKVVSLGSRAVGMFGPDRRAVSIAQRQAIYKSTGVGWVRLNASVPARVVNGMTSPDDSAYYSGHGLKIFMSLVSPNLNQPQGVAPPSYSASVNGIVSRYRPSMVAVENELDNPPYNTSSEAYLAELKAACGIAHAANVACTDSGFTTKMLLALLVADDLARQDVDVAMRDAQFLRLWYPYMRLPYNTPEGLARFVQESGAAKARDIIAGLKVAGADRVNLHWYVRSGGAISLDEQNGPLLHRVVAMLKSVSGLPIVGGEVGFDSPSLRDDQVSSQQMAQLLSRLQGEGANPIILWSPGAGLFKPNLHALSIVDGHGRLLGSAAGVAQVARGGIVRCTNN